MSGVAAICAGETHPQAGELGTHPNSEAHNFRRPAGFARFAFAVLGEVQVPPFSGTTRETPHAQKAMAPTSEVQSSEKGRRRWKTKPRLPSSPTASPLLGWRETTAGRRRGRRTPALTTRRSCPMSCSPRRCLRSDLASSRRQASGQRARLACARACGPT